MKEAPADIICQSEISTGGVKLLCRCRGMPKFINNEEVERADAGLRQPAQGTGKAAPQAGRGDQPQQGGQ